MAASLLLDQPDLLAPQRSRRMQYGGVGGDRIGILNGRGRAFEGSQFAAGLSLKWMIAGSADYESSGRRFRLEGASQLLLNPGEPYRLRFRETSESFSVSFSQILADTAWSHFARCGSTLPEFPTVAARSPSLLNAHLAALHEETMQDEPDGDALIEQSFALLGEIASLAHHRRKLARRIPATRTATRHELLRRLARAEDYLLSASRKPTLARAADAASLSPFHLIRVFRAVHGMTPLAFAKRAKLEQARDALLLTRDPIEAIARRAGYESRTAFDRAFHREFGVTPGTIRAGL